MVAALDRLDQLDLLKFIDPQLSFSRPTASLFVAAERASSWFDLLYTGESYRRWLVYLFCLFDKMSEKGVIRVADWLGVSLQDRVLLFEQLPKAKQLLKDARFKISDISSRVGYSDGNYFGKSFKKYSGFSPSEYRERNTQ